jgi:hypothetical protein
MAEDTVVRRTRRWLWQIPLTVLCLKPALGEPDEYG